MYNFTKIHKELKESVKKYIKDNIESKSNGEKINDKEFQDILKGVAHVGYFGMVVPEKYNGSEMDLVSSTLVINELAKVNASLAHIVSSANYTFCYPLLKFGTEEQKKKYLTKCVTGEKLGVLSCTEPQIETKTIFSGKGDKIILNGVKSFVTSGKIADYALVQATNSFEGMEFNRLTFLIVDLKAKGVTISKEQEPMGLKQIGLVEISFKDVELNKDNVLGEINQGGQVLMDIFNLMKLGDSSIALGLAERAYKEALEYMKIRKADNNALINMQSVQFDLAEMKTKLSLMRLLTYTVCENIEKQDANISEDTSMLKLYNTTEAKKICDACLQMFGGFGYIKGNIIEKIFRDVRAMSITGGHLAGMKSMIAFNLNYED
ncbi:acyl-CoA dehydrogenase family protein [Clostridium akagii]|uniref:acyl-CoA dehydrogenase family protein n=1 Tax=Clostridium akagii TaxID=91623 RepID=UPI000478CBA0|nr:acyl-CoA dehydrogenase family protein [Clostridium akagii]